MLGQRHPSGKLLVLELSLEGLQDLQSGAESLLFQVVWWQCVCAVPQTGSARQALVAASGAEPCLGQEREQCPVARTPPYGSERRVCLHSSGWTLCNEAETPEGRISCVCTEGLCPVHKQIKTGHIFFTWDA